MNIMYSDLTPEAQEELCSFWNTTEEEENWESIPLCVLEPRKEEQPSFCK